tara:strand:+ start:4875 stop:5450 length:576 start_codon:yes stop_codon:yes gene_type:complete
MGNLSDHFSGGGGGGSNILEYIEYMADGRVITTTKGDVTVQNVTNYTDISTSYVDLTGSVIEYQPPDDTKYVHFQVEFKTLYKDANNIGHFYAYIDNSSGTATKYTESRASFYNTNHYDNWHILKCTYTVGEDTEDIANGKIGTWDSPRTMKWMCREYSSSYEWYLNRVYHIDGGGSYDYSKPVVTIIATK